MQEKNCQQNACSYTQNICRILNNALSKQLKEFEYSKLLREEEENNFIKHW